MVQRLLVTVDLEKKIETDCDCLYLGDTCATLLTCDGIEEVIEYSQVFDYVDYFRRNLHKHSNPADYSALECFSNQLLYNVFSPMLQRIGAFLTVLHRKEYLVVLDGPFCRKELVPIVGAYGDTTFTLPPDRRTFISVIENYCTQNSIGYEVTGRVRNCIDWRQKTVYLLKMLVVVYLSVVTFLTRTLSFHRSEDSSSCVVIRDARTLSKLVEYLQGRRVLVNPSYRLLCSPFKLLKLLYYYPMFTVRHYAREKFFGEFGGMGDKIFIRDDFYVCSESLMNRVYEECYDKLCYYYTLKLNSDSIDDLLTAEFVGSYSFLEAKALFNKRLTVIQTFAIDCDRTIFLPHVYMREYITRSDMNNFTSMEDSVKCVVRGCDFVPVNLNKELKNVLVVTQPNCEFIEELRAFFPTLKKLSIEMSFGIHIKIHPRDLLDYSEFVDYIIDSPVDDILPCSDLVIGKTSYVLHESIELGVPIVILCDAMQVSSIPYLSFSPGCISDCKALAAILKGYQGFLVTFSKFQVKYFKDN